jgi:hypothetical protein
MYVTAGGKLTEPGIRKIVRKKLKEWMMDEMFTIKQRKKYAQMLTMLHTGEFKLFSQMLIDINKNLLNHVSGKGISIVECVVQRSPQGRLDKGSHYFDVRYFSRDKKLQYVHPYNDAFAELIDMEQGKALKGWYFISSAIGMSRQLDATDNLFVFIKRLGGCYCQL